MEIRRIKKPGSNPRSFGRHFYNRNPEPKPVEEFKYTPPTELNYIPPVELGEKLLQKEETNNELTYELSKEERTSTPRFQEEQSQDINDTPHSQGVGYAKLEN